MILKVVDEFTDAVGGRFKSGGKYSGEEFRDDILIPKFELAKSNNEKLIIDFDGGYGYPIAFLDEVFYGLTKIYSPSEILSVLEFISEDEPSLIDEIKSCILNV